MYIHTYKYIAKYYLCTSGFARHDDGRGRHGERKGEREAVKEGCRKGQRQGGR